MSRIKEPILRFLYKWLPILCGCHCREDRSFHWHGRRFPVCARCTGELLGIMLAVFSAWAWHPAVSMLIILLLPMLADGFVQLLTQYESNNTRRLITGLLFGYSLAILVAITLGAAYSMGHSFGASMLSERL